MIFQSLNFSVLPPKHLTPLLGLPVRLSCAAESDLTPSITWLKDGKPSLTADTRGGYSLIWALQVCAAPKGRVFQLFWS